VSLACLTACGTRGVSGADGGDGGSSAPETLAAGRRSFDVVATLGAVDAGAIPGANLPPTNAFTLVLDADARRVIVGARGSVAVVPVTSADGRTFQIPGFSVGTPFDGCEGATMLDYTSLQITVSGSSLHGRGTGIAHVSCGDCTFAVPFVADVAGGVDVTPPLLILGSGASPANPFDGFSLVASEPLPATSTARLVATDGSHIDLVPSIIGADIPLIAGFSKPEVVLPYGDGFVVALDGLVDFAGHQGSSDTPLRLTSFATPPLMPEDGFESAAGAQVGGATVISAGPLPPIAGARSVYIGRQGAPSPGGIAVGTALRVRLAVQPGDTKLRFSYEIVSPFQGAGFAGAIDFGSVGRTPGRETLTAATGAPTTWPDGSVVFVTPVTSREIALPADVTDELVVAIETALAGCGGPVPAPSGLLIDDLRIE
jgi:hypothetical protein